MTKCRVVPGTLVLLISSYCLATTPAPVGYWLSPEDFIVVPVAKTNALDFISAGGYLTPVAEVGDDGRDLSGTFHSYLLNTPKEITVGRFGSRVSFENERWYTPLHYDLEQAQTDGVSIADDLMVLATQTGRECWTTVPGDTNYDCEVNFEDFLSLANNFGSTDDAIWPDGDFDWDKRVTFLDFLLLANSYDAVASTRASVPEPSSLLLLAVCSAVVLTRRRLRCSGGVQPLFPVA